MSCRRFKFRRASAYDQAVRFTYTGFDWTGVQVRIQLREGDAQGPVVATFDSGGGDPGTTLSMAVTGPGVYEGALYANESLTRNWPDYLVGDIWAYRGSPRFGPKIFFPFVIELDQNSSDSPNAP